MRGMGLVNTTHKLCKTWLLWPLTWDENTTMLNIMNIALMNWMLKMTIERFQTTTWMVDDLQTSKSVASASNYLTSNVLILKKNHKNTFTCFMISTLRWRRYIMTSSNANIFRRPRYWPFVRGIHRSLDQWRGALIFSLICTRTNGWAINQDVGD